MSAKVCRHNQQPKQLSFTCSKNHLFPRSLVRKERDFRKMKNCLPGTQCNYFFQFDFTFLAKVYIPTASKGSVWSSGTRQVNRRLISSLTLDIKAGWVMGQSFFLNSTHLTGLLWGKWGVRNIRYVGCFKFFIKNKMG